MMTLILLTTMAAQDTVSTKDFAPPKEVSKEVDQNQGKTIGELSYGRAKKEAKSTGIPQPILYVFGNKHAPQIANWLSRIKAANMKLPHIVDLEKISDKNRAEVRASITEDMKEPFLQTIHATGAGYGPIWWQMKRLSLDGYKVWLKRSERPAIYYNYNSGRRGRRFFRSSSISTLFSGNC